MHGSTEKFLEPDERKRIMNIYNKLKNSDIVFKSVSINDIDDKSLIDDINFIKTLSETLKERGISFTKKSMDTEQKIHSTSVSPKLSSQNPKGKKGDKWNELIDDEEIYDLREQGKTFTEIARHFVTRGQQVTVGEIRIRYAIIYEKKV